MTTINEQFRTYLGALGVDAPEEEIDGALEAALSITGGVVESAPAIEQRDDTSHRELLNDALGRMANRVCRHANDYAKSPNKLWAWTDDLSGERAAFPGYVLPAVAACLAHLGRKDTAADVCNVLSGRFFAALSAAFTVPANDGETLTATVARITGEFERIVPEQLTTFFFEGEQ